MPNSNVKRGIRNADSLCTRVKGEVKIWYDRSTATPLTPKAWYDFHSSTTPPDNPSSTSTAHFTAPTRIAPQARHIRNADLNLYRTPKGSPGVVIRYSTFLNKPGGSLVDGTRPYFAEKAEFTARTIEKGRFFTVPFGDRKCGIGKGAPACMGTPSGGLHAPNSVRAH